MSYYCPNCGGGNVLKDLKRIRSAKKIRLNVYKCTVCFKVYLIHVLTE